MRRVAKAFWIVLAVVAWNAVFDRVLIDAGLEYVRTAADAARGPGPFARIDDVMRPAIPRALALASAVAGALLAAGFGVFRWSARATSKESLRKT